jgi:hypothetical protein
MGYIFGMSQLPNLSVLMLASVVLSLSSCVPLAVGAAAGYVARDNGYEVQSPLKKSGDSVPNDEENSAY